MKACDASAHFTSRYAAAPPCHVTRFAHAAAFHAFHIVADGDEYRRARASSPAVATPRLR